MKRCMDRCRKRRTNRWVRAALLCCIAFSLTGCGFRRVNSWEWLKIADNVVGVLGASQITADEELLGQRVCHDDAYVGNYEAQCQGSTGRDVVFGGGSIETRRLQVYGRILAEEGQATVRIRMNEEVVELAADEEIDAVAIVTPDFAHADIACAMADAGKDILIEKPLATTREDIDRICEGVFRHRGADQHTAAPGLGREGRSGVLP